MKSMESSLSARIHMPGAAMSQTKSHYEKQSVFINHVINRNYFWKKYILIGREILVGLPILRQLSCLLL